MIRPAIAWIMGGAGFLSGLMIVASMLVMSIEVFFRFVLGNPTFWALEVSTYLLVATTCLGVGYTLRMRGHVAVEVVVDALPDFGERICARLVAGIAGLFGLVMIWYGAKEVILSYRVGDISLTPLAVPIFLPLSLIPLGGLLLVIQAAEHMIDPPERKTDSAAVGH